MQHGGARPPNVLVTGTPGTGKTTTAAQLAKVLGLRHINVGDLVQQEELHSGWDAEHEAFLLDEDKVVDALEEALSAGGCLVDHHSCDFFPERWFDLVVVLTADNGVLYDRLEQRGYSAAKVQENVQCEIMMVLVEEAHESYRHDIILTLPSNTPEDMASNVQKCVDWLEAHHRRSAGVT